MTRENLKAKYSLTDAQLSEKLMEINALSDSPAVNAYPHDLIEFAREQD